MINLPRFAFALASLVALVGCGGAPVADKGGAPVADNKGGAGGGANSAGGALPENIDGTYLIHSMNYQGEIRLPDDVAERMRKSDRTVIFESGKMTKHKTIAKQTTKDVYDITIDRTKSPAQVTFTRELSNGEKETTYGVMTMINDQLTVCHYMASQNLKPEERPTEITNGPAIVTMKLNKEG